MHGCKKCTTVGGVLFLVAGLLFLLQDLGTWNFWGVSWYTVLFLLWGLGSVCKSKCPDCQACGSMPDKKKR
ncbi:hypothetical protein HZB02_00425 [Candidatus Woesearchaeota archaeon]|nr:hypothetical protein [Candidatus Woesearchaeota archaeon]